LEMWRLEKRGCFAEDSIEIRHRGESRAAVGLSSTHTNRPPRLGGMYGGSSGRGTQRRTRRAARPGQLYLPIAISDDARARRSQTRRKKKRSVRDRRKRTGILLLLLGSVLFLCVCYSFSLVLGKGAASTRRVSGACSPPLQALSPYQLHHVPEEEESVASAMHPQPRLYGPIDVCVYGHSSHTTDSTQRG